MDGNEICGCGDLWVGGGGGDEFYFFAVGFDGGGFVGDLDVTFEDVGVSGADEIGLENLGGFHEPEVLAGDGCGGEIGFVGAFQGFGDAAGEGGCSIHFRGGDGGEDVGLGDEWAGGVVDGDQFRIRGNGGEAVGDGEVAGGSTTDASDGFGESGFVEQGEALGWADDQDLGNGITSEKCIERAREHGFAIYKCGELVEAHALAAAGGDEDGGNFAHTWWELNRKGSVAERKSGLL